ncbi:MAG: hypothetical protein IJP74_09000 [Prevotella sp.]|nr:hypothetical protein [Prevotella sp.]
MFHGRKEQITFRKPSTFGTGKRKNESFFGGFLGVITPHCKPLAGETARKSKKHIARGSALGAKGRGNTPARAKAPKNVFALSMPRHLLPIDVYRIYITYLPLTVK